MTLVSDIDFNFWLDKWAVMMGFTHISTYDTLKVCKTIGYCNLSSNLQSYNCKDSNIGFN